MKLKNAMFIASILSVIIGCTSKTPEIIKISEEMVINETGSGEHMNWFDEQDTTGIPETLWDTYGVTTYWPAGLIIDLGCHYQITSIWVFDGKKDKNIEGGKFQVSSGKPFAWENPHVLEMQNSGKWLKIDLNTQTQFVQLQKHATEQYDKTAEFPKNCDVAIKEVVIVGYPLEEKVVEDVAATQKPVTTTMDKFIGMNSYISTPDRVHEAIGSVREYRPWRWNGVMDLETPIDWGDIRSDKGHNEYAGMEIGNSDEYYQKMLDMGIECVPCIHRHVDEENEEESKPNFGGDPDDPFSYKLISDYSFQYVARYGHNPVEDRLLRTTEVSPKKTGMGLIRYFENWNEPNGWWGWPSEHFTPYEFAAFCSASYDGHLNQMGEGFGVKNADPNINFVFGGLAGISLSYVQAMKLWSDYHRDGSFPSEVINLHNYCNTMGKQHSGEEAYGISPEADKLKEKLEKVIAWRDKNLPDKEVWLSEFGWDTDSSTYQSAAWGHELYPEKITMEEIQGQWLVREFLIGAAAGLDRMQMFLANDLKNYPHGVYGKCGFITVDEEYKPSWFYVKTLKHALSDMLFQEEVDSGNENVWIYQFKNPENGRGAYVLWCPTSDGTSVDGFQLNLSEKVNSVTQIRLEDQKELGEKEALTVVNHKVEVNVSERPVIVQVDEL
ncbi:hypothetical protein [Sunxiuqinia indica]|uniref:hypothetical protein n=1 Tax=Sunxiuqinia indica TaxID=2692584 RepID=UPI0013579910|nr:hypothetical protein [Sunxiuqinia indica]